MMQSERTAIVCIVGPTASHKTETSIRLAKRLSGEIVSADSVQVYLGMDVGSAKPTLAEREGVLHHLLDCVPVDAADFSVAQFRRMADEAIEGITARGHIPIVVGGSGLYVNALTHPLGFAVPSDADVRARLNQEYDASPCMVYERLSACDPITAKRLHPNDRKRVVRALEVFCCSGKPLSAYGNDFMNETHAAPPYEAILLGLTMERSVLYERIDRRVDLMLENGLLEEARRLYDAGYDRTLPAMQSIGYKQLFVYFDGNCSLNEAVEQIKRDTRHFAKRQTTWFRRDERITWFDATVFDEALVEKITKEAEERLSK